MHDHLASTLIEIAHNEDDMFTDESVGTARRILSSNVLNEQNKQRIVREVQLTRAADPKYIQATIGLLKLEALPTEMVPYIEKDRELPTETHIALIIGRQQSSTDGTDILANIESTDVGIGEVDYALRRGQLADEHEIREAEQQLLELLDYAVDGLVERLADDEIGTVKITHQLFGMLTLKLGHNIARLQDQYPGKLKFELNQWVQGTYQKVGEM